MAYWEFAMEAERERIGKYRLGRCFGTGMRGSKNGVYDYLCCGRLGMNVCTGYLARDFTKKWTNMLPCMIIGSGVVNLYVW